MATGGAAPVYGPTPPGVPSETRRRVPLLALISGCALAVMTVGLAVGQWRGVDRLRSLPDGVRGATYERALQDIEQICVPPDGLSGPLREHCLEQAQFVMIFPECGADCRRVVDPLLPHARR